MSSWLSKATKTFVRSAPEPAQPFDIDCACGDKVYGMRQADEQIVECTQCGLSLFVLPKNVYPKSKRKSKAGLPKESAAKGTQNSEVPEAPHKEVGPPLRRRIGQRAQQMRSSTRAVVRRGLAWPKRIFTPFRLVMLSVMAALVGTIYWGWHLNNLEQAETDFLQYSKSGQIAFESLNFSDAVADLSKANAAINVLKRDDQKARLIRQMYREANAYQNLCLLTLFDIINEANDERSRRWDATFLARHADRWIVLETTVARAPNIALEQDETGEDDDRSDESELPRPQCSFEYLFFLDDSPAMLIADAELLSRLSLDDFPKRVVIAAQLKSCRFVSNRWLIRLRHDTAFLWANFESLDALGFGVDELHPEDALRDLLLNQQQLMGIER